ncbi:hypothetical protein ES703_85033 [subsurface metagenome]
MYSVDELADGKNLIDRVLRFQESHEYTSIEMAKRIGCTRQTYGKILDRVRNGELVFRVIVDNLPPLFFSSLLTEELPPLSTVRRNCIAFQRNSGLAVSSPFRTLSSIFP